MKNTAYWIKKLELEAHPEGGYYKEVYRGKQKISPFGYDGDRNVATSIYFLLGEKDKSHFHRLKSDEIWYFHDGDPLKVCMILEDGTCQERILGNNLEKGESLQVILEAGTIFGAYHPDEKGYTLIGCMVSPGFDFRDFEIIRMNQLIRDFPKYTEIIDKLGLG